MEYHVDANLVIEIIMLLEYAMVIIRILSTHKVAIITVIIVK